MPAKSDPKLNLFILDLDGTMMPSHEVDNECYWQAVRGVFGIPAFAPDLAHFENVTDSGILTQWVWEQFGRNATKMEVRRVRTLFLHYLQREAEKHRQDFLPTPGLEAWLKRMRPDTARRVAIATGGWGHTAGFKLRISGLAHFDLPLASADDAAHRPGIMAAALDKLTGGRRSGPCNATYIGDSPWDARSASFLGWDFIGIARSRRATALREAGAVRIYRDFRALMDDRRPPTERP